MKIYTKSGDQGTTGLLGNARVLKCDLRIEAYGTVDELNAFLGLAASNELPGDVQAVLATLQNQLFDLGAELASENAEQKGTASITESQVSQLEEWIDRYEQDLPPLRNFILPGGNRASAALHVARCVCRRAERTIVALGQQSSLRGVIVQYVNRLGDLLFVLARTANARAGVEDIHWQKLD